MHAATAYGVASLLTLAETVELNRALGAAQHPDADRLDRSPVAKLLCDGFGKHGLAGCGGGRDARCQVHGGADVVARRIDPDKVQYRKSLPNDLSQGEARSFR